MSAKSLLLLTPPLLPLLPQLLLPPPSKACDPNVRPTVQVVDDCDACAANQINLYAPVFGKMAPLDLGRLSIEYREVSELVGLGPINLAYSVCWWLPHTTQQQQHTAAAAAHGSSITRQQQQE
jgi:hypothetical protein